MGNNQLLKSTGAEYRIDHLLEAVTPEAPCGENLEYDPAFQEMEAAAQPKPPPEFEPDKPAEPPDWKQTQASALDVLARSKDLRSAVLLSKALLHTQGFSGLRDGLQLIQGLLEKYWETLHPQLDPDDDYDPTMRINIITSLCDQDFMLRDLREAPLVSSPLLGRFSLRDINVATGVLTLPAGSTETPPKLSSIDAAFMECDLGDLQAKAGAVRESIISATAIEAFLTEQVGAANAPNLSDLERTLEDIQKVLTDRLARRGVSELTPGKEIPEAAVVSGAAAPQPARAPLTGEISSRGDVIRALDKICEYYQRCEPSSPVPLLLKRAKRLVSMDFIDILRDLAPNGVAQVELISGTGGEQISK